MDQIKIGKFIAEMRKEQNLTQIDLAEKLGISNKTISKWEYGKCCSSTFKCGVQFCSYPDSYSNLHTPKK